MTTTELRLPGSVAEIRAGPKGPTVGAFFDLDGTVIAGYSARHITREGIKGREVSARNILQTLGVVVSAGGITPESFGELLELGAHHWRGRTVEDLDEMGLRLFEKAIADLIYPEMREIVHAHRQQGHTVALASSAASFQVEPVAAFLGVDHVICNRFVTEDGVFTGEVEQPVLWGASKADAVQAFAQEQGVDLRRSYFYAEGDDDTPLMYLVGHARPTNPGKRLARVAAKRGWPVLRFTSRGEASLLRMVAGLASVVPVAWLGLVTGLLRRNKWAGLNFIGEHSFDLLFRIIGVKINAVGRENAIAQRPAVFIFNHRNNFDGIIAASIIQRDFTSVAKAELKADPLVGTFARLVDIAFVDRSDTASAVAALKPLEQLAAKGLSVMIAPEGRRFDTAEVGPFKKGAFRIAMTAGIPIVPIVIRNAEMIAARNTMSPNPGTVDVAVLPPIPVHDWTLDDLEKRIEDVRQRYLETLRTWPG